MGNPPVLSGLDIITTEKPNEFRGRRIATIANHTAVTSDLTLIYDVLAQGRGFEFVFLYSPFHGVRGDHQDSEEGQHIDKKTGRPVYPAALLRGKDRAKEIEEHRVDTIVFDLQSAGSKYFGFKNVLSSAMEVAARTGVEVVVLDRPNPLGGLKTEGEVESVYRPRIGWYQIPNVHGMTYGELASMFNEEQGISCELTVMRMSGWRRRMWYDDTGMFWPVVSCNLPTLESCLAFAGTCLFEGTNVSEGRGTTRPFEIIGAPWLGAEELSRVMNGIGLPGVKFGQAHFIPTSNPIRRFSKFAGQKCQGVRLYITDRKAFQPVRTAVHLLAEIMSADPEEFAWLETEGHEVRYYMDWLAGSEQLRTKLEQGVPPGDIIDSWTDMLDEYNERRRKYLLYD